MIRYEIKKINKLYLLISIAVSVIIMFVIMLEQRMQNESIFEIVEMDMYLCEYMLVFVMAMLPCVNGFSDDLERGEIYQILIRKKLKEYVIEKSISIFLWSVLIVCSSMLVFVCILRLTGHLWVSDSIEEYYRLNGIGFPDLELWCLIEKNKHILFYTIAGSQMGLLAGVVSLLGTLLSLFIRNRMMVLFLPVIVLYVMYEYLSGFFGYGYGIYGLFNLFQNYTFVGENFTIRATATAVIIGGMIIYLIYQKIKRIVQYE